MKHNIRKYVTYFKLVKTGEDIYSNVGGRDVLKVENNSSKLLLKNKIIIITKNQKQLIQTFE